MVPQWHTSQSHVRPPTSNFGGVAAVWRPPPYSFWKYQDARHTPLPFAIHSALSIQYSASALFRLPPSAFCVCLIRLYLDSYPETSCFPAQVSRPANSKASPQEYVQPWPSSICYLPSSLVTASAVLGLSVVEPLLQCLMCLLMACLFRVLAVFHGSVCYPASK